MTSGQRLTHLLRLLCLLILPWTSAHAAQSPAAAELERQLRPQLAGTLAVSESALPQAVATFYEQRLWQPAWNDKRLQVLIGQLEDLRSDGLEPEDYGLAALKAMGRASDPATVALRERAATKAYLQALVDLFRGKVDPVRLDPHWNFDSRQIDPLRGLQLAREAVENDRIADMFRNARPTLPQYNVVRSALARYRGLLLEHGEWPQIPAGDTLKPGMRDARVPLLRQRLHLAGLLSRPDAADPELYDNALRDAVQRFQRESYLDADGAVGAGTVRELNIPVSQRIGQLRANLERLRWFERQDRERALIVDLAGYRILYQRDGQTVWQSRVQIGKTVRQTPIFQSVVSHVTLNPTWTVPPTIFRNDSLPAIRRDRGYLAKNRLRVLDARSGRELSPASVNWASPGNILLRQDAGPGNALGRLVIRFPNDYAIYLHDTPHQGHFSASQRAFSSGCIRVENIAQLVVLLMDDAAKWSAAGLEQALSDGKTRNVNLSKRVPILIAYWTVDIGADGYVSFKPDVYGQDAGILKALDAPRRAQPAANVDPALASAG